MKGSIHSVETFGTVDGPGIRYVLFLSGCDLRCRFCHNRDTWERQEKTITVAEVLTEMENYRPFYEPSAGGITVSGGEPLLQAPFVAALLRACRERGFHTAVDTGGFYPAGALSQVMPFADLIQFSVKAVDAEKHRLLTGRDNTVILENLRQAAAGAAELVVRYVVIPGMNDSAADLALLAGLITSLPRTAAVELLPYHTMGKVKWERLGLPYSLEAIPSATAEDVVQAAAVLRQSGLIVKKTG
ncbi:radical sam [Lucifera butyrica]|uniref:Pyruvate formate-lyase-activating enzyme n=1 Tax=Lucifera butyrica TaxID=1351585 RepID=A0A498RA64_9FIRM|nr:pyruvate formate-lyase-activating protein [Lucifera butyrica]VBB07837.1 radical sam [Lucifera butyrica]